MFTQNFNLTAQLPLSNFVCTSDLDGNLALQHAGCSAKEHWLDIRSVYSLSPPVASFFSIFLEPTDGAPLFFREKGNCTFRVIDSSSGSRTPVRMYITNVGQFNLKFVCNNTSCEQVYVEFSTPCSLTL